MAPTLSQQFLERFGAVGRTDWSEGVYFLAEGWRMVLVAVHQLPGGI
ncbi:hypothetical protein [Candidatus Cyanaurora vandensis]|nr:hypothetical protein [Candidatus Cyanaurora vandensis]